MPANRNISFGDNVRVIATPETDATGVAGCIGHVYGETTPSVTGVPVVGVSGQDHAINVHFEERGDTLWFASELLELVDHAVGTEIHLDGVPKTWTRSASGEWIEAPQQRPCWKFS